MWVLFFFPFRILALQENFLLQFKMDVSGDISLDWFLLPVLLYISQQKPSFGKQMAVSFMSMLFAEENRAMVPYLGAGSY